MDKFQSPYQRLQSIGIRDCQWTTGFWADKFSTCKDHMLPYMGDLLCGDIGHALNNFKIAAGLKEGNHAGMYWHDGDFYKWLEASLYVYALTNDESILNQVNTCIDIIAKAQEEDGYLQTQVQLRPDVDRYENRKYHEMYNTGHLLTSACIHHQVTGERQFLDIAIRHADLLCTLFLPETKQLGRFGFNQTQIIGLMDLYRITRKEKYLTLAQKFIDRRGKYPVEHHSTTEGYPIGDMVQERTPLRESEEAAGHAVLALYYYAGAAAVYSETGEKALRTSLKRLWENVTTRKMYLTGAVGQTHYGASSNRDKIEEGFIDDFMLPNMTAYNETCANICNAIFSQSMLEIEGDSKYADIVETVLYNSMLSGISLNGKEYFYANPLRMVHNSRNYGAHENATESPTREPYLDCFCCPPNLLRSLAKASKWAYSLSKEGITVNLFGANTLDTKLLDGTNLVLTQETDYPWDQTVKITLHECSDAPFEIALRIPGWCDNASVTINGEEIDAPIVPGTYCKIKRSWRSADQIGITLPMTVSWLEGHPRVEEVRNQVAIRRGPIVYCLESADLPADTSILDAHIDIDQNLEVESRPDFLGGINVIKATVALRPSEDDHLYRVVNTASWKNFETQLIPYFAWSNRGLSEMTVFLPVIWNRPTTN